VGPYVGPFQGLGGGTAAIRRSNQTTFPLTKLLVLARRWTWIACIGQEMDVEKIYAKLPLWQLIPLSCHNGNLAHTYPQGCFFVPAFLYTGTLSAVKACRPHALCGVAW
jgi:hypothetical protein